MSRFLRIMLLLAMGVGLLVSINAPQSAEPSQGKKFALLVGVKHYDHSDFKILRYTENDVTDLAKLLQTNGYEVVLLCDSVGAADEKRKPNKANIEREMKSLLDRCKRDDTVLLGFAGHGLQFAGQDDCYFCPLDAKPFKDKAQSLLSLNMVYDEMRKSGAGAKLLLVDACRNDPSPDRGRGIDNDNAPSPPKGIGVLFSCSAGERAYEPDALKHGIFFYYVLEGLRGEAKDPRDEEVTWDTLRAYVKKQVSRELPKLEKDQAQHPQEKGELSGDSPVLVALNTKKAPPPLKAPFTAKEAKEAQEIWAKHLGRKVVEEVDLGGGITMEFVLIPPGSFQMGSPMAEKGRNPFKEIFAEDFDAEKLHPVAITKPFFVTRFPVTQEQYEKVLGKNPSYFAVGGKGKDLVKGLDTAKFPVDTVWWGEAETFCTTAAPKVPWGKLTLPSEAQWEYACRAGTTTPFYFGDSCDGLQANCNGQFPYGNEKKGRYLGRTCRVGGDTGTEYKPNSFGLSDMHGNVWQLCLDYYGSCEKLAKENPVQVIQATRGNTGRVLRGGSWDDPPTDARAANRAGIAPTGRLNSIGFRICVRLD
jgi:formylglycine-generating enzyme required for sulfatase activity